MYGKKTKSEQKKTRKLTVWTISLWNPRKPPKLFRHKRNEVYGTYGWEFFFRNLRIHRLSQFNKLGPYETAQQYILLKFTKPRLNW